MAIHSNGPVLAAQPLALQAEGVGFRYGARTVLHDVSFALRPGEMVALLGRNGVGKSTLLGLLSGVLTPAAGRVSLRERPLAGLTRRHIARALAVVPQELQVPFAFTTREVVAMGRTPHVTFMSGETAGDHAAVERAIDLLDLADLAARPYNSLSGGERQRTVLALALAQQPEVLLLDEPTVHLDLAHQLEVLRLIGELNRREGLTVLATIHDINLAALYFERLLLLKDGRLVADGPPASVVTAATVREVFGAPVSIYAHPTTGAPQVAPLL